MTPEEQDLLLACGEFCHFTTADRLGGIKAGGLDPDLDDSLVLRGPKREKAVYFCPVSSSEKAKDFIGARADDQAKLYVYRILVGSLSQKNCGPDIGCLVNLVDEIGYTVAASLQLGTIACYEIIPHSELTGPEEIENPQYKRPGDVP